MDTVHFFDSNEEIDQREREAKAARWTPSTSSIPTRRSTNWNAR
jgi:hypothetical protein